jgi:hypothetical protein
MSASIGIFLVVLGASAGLFALNVERLVRYMRVGLPENRANEPRTRLRNLLSIGILQSKIFREQPAGIMLATLLWGLMLLPGGKVDLIVQCVLFYF